MGVAGKGLARRATPLFHRKAWKGSGTLCARPLPVHKYSRHLLRIKQLSDEKDKAARRAALS